MFSSFSARVIARFRLSAAEPCDHHRRRRVGGREQVSDRFTANGMTRGGVLGEGAQTWLTLFRSMRPGLARCTR
jgi:hypothetical protein